MSKSQRIKSILNDDDFKGVVDDIRASLTKKVMHKGTAEEERPKLLAEFHALETLMSKMRSIAQDAENKND